MLARHCHSSGSTFALKRCLSLLMQVPKEVVREVIKEVVREVPVEVPVEVIKEVRVLTTPCHIQC